MSPLFWSVLTPLAWLGFGCVIWAWVRSELDRRSGKAMARELDNLLNRAKQLPKQAAIPTTHAAPAPNCGCPVCQTVRGGQLQLPTQIVQLIQGAAAAVCGGRVKAVETKIQGMNSDGVVDLRMLTTSAEVYERVVHPALVAAFPNVYGADEGKAP